MLAVSERVRVHGQAPDRIVWHKPAAGHRCTGDCDFHPIACSKEEGIALPSAKQDIPIRLDKPGETWCPDCLALIRQK